MRTSWQSATPAKPIASIAADQTKIALRLGSHEAVPAIDARERHLRLAVSLIPRAEDVETEAGTMFWIYWDTAWSLIISGIMFATIVTHPDAEFVEVHAAKRRM